MMAKAMKKEGLDLVHLIGPKTAHKYEPETKKEVARWIDELAAKGRPAAPERVKFTTYTLRYNRSYWLTVDRLEKHWERADVDADLSGKATTRNVAAFHIWVSFQHHQARTNGWLTVRKWCLTRSTAMVTGRIIS